MLSALFGFVLGIGSAACAVNAIEHAFKAFDGHPWFNLFAAGWYAIGAVGIMAGVVLGAVAK